MARGILKVRGNFLNFYAVIAVPVHIGLDFFAKFDIVARKTFCTLFILQNPFGLDKADCEVQAAEHSVKKKIASD